MALFYANLQEAWYSERVQGLNDALAAQGWQRLAWCDGADWEAGSWMDPSHPERPTASLFLARLLSQIPVSGPILLCGDSTLSNWLREEWPGGRIWYDWEERERFLRDSGAPPGSAMWSIPGDRCAGIAEQIRNARAWSGVPSVPYCWWVVGTTSGATLMSWQAS